MLKREFVEEMKASGFVAAALSRSGQRNAAVAPAARWERDRLADWLRTLTPLGLACRASRQV